MSNANTPQDAGTTLAASTSNQNQLAAAAWKGPKTKIRKARRRLRGADNDGCRRQLTPVEVSIGAYHRHEHEEHSNGEKRHVAEEMCPRPGSIWNRVRDRLVEVDRNELSRSNADDGSGWYPDDLTAKTEGYFSFSQTTGRMPLMDDVCFVLNFLVRYGIQSQRAEDEGARSDNSVMRDILFLLENQIPWPLLREMHRCMPRRGGGPNDDDGVLDRELAGRVWKLLEDRLYTKWRRVPCPDPSHLLHLVHHFFKPTPGPTVGPPPAETTAGPTVGAPPAQRTAGPTVGAPPAQTSVDIDEPPPPHMGRWRRATEYRRYALLKLKRRDFKEGEVESVLDVHLEGGTLWIPTLQIHDLTCTILRNLIALEDGMRMRKRPVTAYCLFMSQLACKVEDVELLQGLGILHNFLGTDEDVVRAFGDLLKGVVFEVDKPQVNYLNDTWHELEKRCQREPINFIGLFLEKYCSNKVHTIAFFFAAALFLFEATQVAFAIVSYFRPHTH